MLEVSNFNGLSQKSTSENRVFDVDSITSIRHFERFLRAAGFSRGRAKMIAAHGWNGAREAHMPAFLLRTTRWSAGDDR